MAHDRFADQEFHPALATVTTEPDGRYKGDQSTTTSLSIPVLPVTIQAPTR